MKNLFFLFVICFILLSCKDKEKQNTNIEVIPTQNENVIQSAVVPIEDDQSIDNIVTDNRNYREYIDNYDPKLLLLFEVEGNFTNSGNKEILAFYQGRSLTKYNAIELVYCFVLDYIGEKVQSIYKIPEYGSLQFNLGEIPSVEEFGRDVIWLDARIGYLSDFNNNGKEELFIYSIYGGGVDFYIYEFNGNEFIEIADPYYALYYITSVDKENKIIKFGPAPRGPYYFSLIWNEKNQRYEQIKN